MKYIYFRSDDGQVMASFDTPVLADQAGPVSRGLVRALVPEGTQIGVDHKVTVDANGVVASVVVSPNPDRLPPSPPPEIALLRDKIMRGHGAIQDVLRLIQLELGG